MYSAPYYFSRRRTPGHAPGFKKAAVILVFIVIISCTGFGLIRLANIPVAGKLLPGFILGKQGENAVNLMCAAMPSLYNMTVSGNGLPLQLTGVPVDKFFHVFRLDRQDPLALLEHELPLLAEHQPPAVPVIKDEGKSLPAAPAPGESENEQSAVPVPGESENRQSAAPKLSGDCLVAIYNTHTGETYALTDGMDRLQGKRGGVEQVAGALQRVLEENYGIRVARSDKIHDEVYQYSYVNSKKTLEKLLVENPRILVVLDIHRDAGLPREGSIVRINGELVAPILIIVGSDARSAFPGWHKNYNFARTLAAEMEEKYPGLCKGIRVQEGRYNQHLHSRALLLEIGSVSNSTAEAVRSAELLGDVLAVIIKDLQDKDEEV